MTLQTDDKDNLIVFVITSRKGNRIHGICEDWNAVKKHVQRLKDDTIILSADDITVDNYRLIK